MVLILLRNATSIHSRLDARRWRLTCISMHLRLHPSFAYSTSLGRAETRASRLDTFFLDEYFFLPFSYISLSLSPRISQRQRRSHSRPHPLGTKREREKRVIKRDKRHATISILSLSLSLVSSESLSQSRPLLAFQRRRKSGNACHARSSLIRIGYGETRKLIRWNFPLFPSRLERETVKEARRQGL